VFRNGGEQKINKQQKKILKVNPKGDLKCSLVQAKNGL